MCLIFIDIFRYRIEKDLLKETYSSIIQAINIILVMILGVFTIIGFLGVRSIDRIKKEFQTELEEIRKLREQYQEKFAEIEAEQKRTKDQFEELRTSNEKQDNRLQILEIQEKCSSLMKSRNYERALKYLKVGLESAPNDIIMLQLKMGCLTQMSNFPGAIQCGQLILEHEPGNIHATANLAELYLTEKDVADYELLIEKNGAALSESYSPYLIWHLEAIKQYIKKDSDALVGIIKEMLAEKPSGKALRIKEWNFAEVKSAFAEDPDSSVKSLFFKCIDFLEGKNDESELESALKEEEVTTS